MGPVKEKEKQPRKAPDFIDDKFIKTLSPEKQAYWKRRKEGKNGMEDLTPKERVIKTPQDVTTGFDNEGNMVIKTRAMRRQKIAYDVRNTKRTHTMMKARKK